MHSSSMQGPEATYCPLRCGIKNMNIFHLLSTNISLLLTPPALFNQLKISNHSTLKYPVKKMHFQLQTLLLTFSCLTTAQITTPPFPAPTAFLPPDECTSHLQPHPLNNQLTKPSIHPRLPPLRRTRLHRSPRYPSLALTP